MKLTGDFKLLGFQSNVDKNTGELKAQTYFVVSPLDEVKGLTHGSKVEEYYTTFEDSNKYLHDFDPKATYSITISVDDFNTKEGKKTFKRIVDIAKK